MALGCHATSTRLRLLVEVLHHGLHVGRGNRLGRVALIQAEGTEEVSKTEMGTETDQTSHNVGGWGPRNG